MSTPLVVFGEDWGAHPSSTQHIIRCLMQERDVVWVNSIGLRRPKVSMSDIGRVFKKGFSALSSNKGVQATVTPQAVVCPLVIPVPKNTLERNFNRISLGCKIRQALSKFPAERPILWTSLPTAVDFLGCSNERAVVYYCGDDFSGLAGVDHAQVTEAEQRLVERADLILAASKCLANKFPKSKTVHLPHGVDVDLFSSPSPRPADLPMDHPVAGFYGSISDWLDVELLGQVAKALPEWRFVFIGNIRTDVSSLMRRDNVRFLGPKPHHELPGYAQNWTVSLLPFRDNAQIRACNPLKLREYLSTGTPIVSTNFPALDNYRDLISVADEPIGFAQAISNVLKHPDTSHTKRFECVAKETWKNRAQAVSSLLSAL
ncbi:MAG: glycosyl transferase [Rhodospirillaceae bacterium]|nr:MAG: glycosyl transferase [Rhodospirillaceae bacterium]